MGALAVLPFLLVAIWAGIEQADNEKNADLYKDEEEQKEGLTMTVTSCSECKNYICRCSDCFALVEKNELWFCDEYQDYCSNVEECLEYLPTTETSLTMGCDVEV